MEYPEVSCGSYHSGPARPGLIEDQSANLDRKHEVDTAASDYLAWGCLAAQPGIPGSQIAHRRRRRKCPHRKQPRKSVISAVAGSGTKMKLRSSKNSPDSGATAWTVA